MKKIAVLTSGGDSQGMNAAISAIVTSGISRGMEVYGIEDGYKGILEHTISNQKIKRMGLNEVNDIVHKGGTILYTSRCPEFQNIETVKEAAQKLKGLGIEGLIVIGGNGSLSGAKDLSSVGFPVVGLPGTIDNDLAYTDYTLGFDSALNVVANHMKNTYDSMKSHKRVSVLEVMGRDCGDIALYAGLASGAKAIITKENMDIVTPRLVTQSLNKRYNDGKGMTSGIVVVAEGALNALESKQKLEAGRVWKEKLFDNGCKLELRADNVGYNQRGGDATVADRIRGIDMGAHAVELLFNNVHNKLVGLRSNKVISIDIAKGLDKNYHNYAKDAKNKKHYEMANALVLG
jgi:6-phosphofructokinase 1